MWREHVPAGKKKRDTLLDVCVDDGPSAIGHFWWYKKDVHLLNVVYTLYDANLWFCAMILAFPCADRRKFLSFSAMIGLYFCQYI